MPCAWKPGQVLKKVGAKVVKDETSASVPLAVVPGTKTGATADRQRTGGKNVVATLTATGSDTRSGGGGGGGQRFCKARGKLLKGTKRA